MRVRVLTFAGQRDAALPDEVFPNNWLSLHVDGTAVLYPLLAPIRRRERRTDVLAELREQHGYRIGRVEQDQVTGIGDLDLAPGTAA